MCIKLLYCYYVFQSTPPVKAATITQIGVVLKMIFQSTPPVKAATTEEDNYFIIYVISIHAAREGGDNLPYGEPIYYDDFNPRRP